MRRPKNAQGSESIRPVVYGIGIYFLVSGADSFQIGSIGSLLKLVALIPLSLALLDFRYWKVRISPTFIAQLLFWLLTVTSVLYSINADKTFSSVKALTLNLALVFCLGIMEEYNERELCFMQRALLAGGWLAILLMFMLSNFSSGGRLTLHLGERAQDHNYINGYYIYTFSWHCTQMFREKKRIHLLPMLLILTIVLLTGSRGALLAFLVVIFVHTCILWVGTKHKVRNIVLVAFVMLLMLWAFDLVLARMPERVAHRFTWDYLAEKGTAGRSRIWKFLLRHYAGDSILRMIFGHGYGTSSLVNTMNGLVAHNLYLDNLITLGIVGLMLQLFIQGSVVRILIKRREDSLLGAYLGMMCMCLSLSLVAYKPIWNVMLLALAIDANWKVKAAVPGGDMYGIEIQEDCL